MNDAAARTAVYIEVAHRARQATMGSLRPLFGEFSVTEWSNRAFAALWPDSTFPWEKISRKFRDPDRLEIAIWVGKRLVGMALGVSGGNDITLEFLEGDPDSDCPLKGSRTLIALDVASNYAQARGKHRLLVQPMSSGLRNHYTKLGFSPFPPNTGSPHLWKKV